MTYAVVTFGCRENQPDSRAVEAALRAAGAESVPAHPADAVLVNTYSVTSSADHMGRTAWTQRAQTGCRRAELRRVASAGYKAIALTGVHLGMEPRFGSTPSRSHHRR